MDIKVNALAIVMVGTTLRNTVNYVEGNIGENMESLKWLYSIANMRS